MNRGQRRAAAAVAWAAAVALGAAGCSAIPEQSPVEQGPALDETPRQEVSVEVEPPQKDATPEEVVAGFLRAGIDDSGDHRVARQYLTDAASADWRPERRIMVYDDRTQQAVTQVAGERVRLDLGMIGSVDAHGRFREMPPGEQQDLTFHVRQVDGQWRVDDLPEEVGSVMSRADFQRLYKPVQVHWGSAVTEELVPEQRWVRDGEGMASALGRLQSEAVPEGLEGALTTGVPPGARLESAAVPVSDGVATLRLSEAMTSADGADRDLAWAQYTATMRQLPSVDAVSLEAGGSTLDTASDAIGDTLAYPQGAGYSVVSVDVPLVLLHQRDRLRAADPASAELESAPRPQALEVPELPASWERLAVSSDFRTLAAVDDRRLGVWRDGRPTTHETEGALSAPSLDRLGFLWTTQETDDDSEVLVLDTGSQQARPESLEVPWLDRGRIREIRLAPDGTRALVVLEGDEGERVALVGVERGSDGEPTSLTEPSRVAPEVDSGVEDIAWIDEQAFAVLGTAGPGGEQKVWRTELGGWTELQGTVDNAVSISGYPAEREDGLLVTTDGGRVLTRAGSTWFVANVASEVVVPGR
ncbi:LpqB family beta-propeller domain-containing protein [Kytococcus sp. Marseille-QA3725]